jgi:hypothetical protein
MLGIEAGGGPRSPFALKPGGHPRTPAKGPHEPDQLRPEAGGHLWTPFALKAGGHPRIAAKARQKPDQPGEGEKSRRSEE